MITSRLALGFSLLLYLFIGTSIVSIYALNSAASGFKNYREFARNTNNAGRIQANFLSVRIAALDYISTSNPEALRTEQQRIKLLTELSQKAQAEAINQQQLQTFQTIESLVSLYSDTFKQIEEKIALRHKIVNEQLNVLGPKMERSLSAIWISAREDGDIEAAYLASLSMRNQLFVRLYVIKFIDTNAVEDV